MTNGGMRMSESSRHKSMNATSLSLAMDYSDLIEINKKKTKLKQFPLKYDKSKRKEKKIKTYEEISITLLSCLKKIAKKKKN